MVIVRGRTVFNRPSERHVHVTSTRLRCTPSSLVSQRGCAWQSPLRSGAEIILRYWIWQQTGLALRALVEVKCCMDLLLFASILSSHREDQYLVWSCYPAQIQWHEELWEEQLKAMIASRWFRLVVLEALAS